MTTQPKPSERPDNFRVVLIKDLVRDRRYQVRKGLNRGAVQQYAKAYEAGVELPPVSVAKVRGSAGRWALVLIDGWHRVQALESLGLGDVEALITEATESEARWLAAEANLAHGVQLKRAEHREVFRAYVRAGRVRRKHGHLKSYREIALELHGAVHFTTLNKWMEKDFPRLARQMAGRDDYRKGDGLRETNPEDGFTKKALDGIASTLAASAGVGDPEKREVILKALERAVEAVRGAKDTPNLWKDHDF